jgi:hypothetical protein
MDIHFVSSLTPEDENRLASALAGVIEHLLRHFPVAYTLRIETTDATVFQRSGPEGTPPFQADSERLMS